MIILFFVVLPLATILISIVLQKLLKSPILVAILIFAIYLILAFTVFTAEFLINAIIYTILAFLTAVIAKIICCLIKKLDCKGEDFCNNENGLEESIENLQNAVESLQDNVSDLNDMISRIINNNSSCGCNRRLNR